jgi:release factor glutamine methyltransferase
MKTIQEIIQLTTSYLQEKGIPKPRRDAEEMVAFALGKKRIDLYVEFDRPVQEEELQKIREFMKRRSKHEPLEYIFGKVEFFGCMLHITPDVLIPRQETEILLYFASKILEKMDLQGKKAWDVCCGAGCIGLSIKKKFPMLEVSLSDLSAPALEIARKNAIENQVDVEFLQGDLLSPFLGKKVDIFFCNPPYVSLSEYAVLDPGVKDYEPKHAIVGGDSGLAFYERLAKELPLHLQPGAKIFFEIGKDQGKSVIEIFSSPFWKTKVVEKDWSGHDRFFFLEIE